MDKYKSPDYSSYLGELAWFQFLFEFLESSGFPRKFWQKMSAIRILFNTIFCVRNIFRTSRFPVFFIGIL